jgi:hypothetical protein
VKRAAREQRIIAVTSFEEHGRRSIRSTRALFISLCEGIPWVPLSRFDGPPEPIVRQCRVRIDQEAPPNEHENLLVVTQFLARLRYNDPTLFQILGGRKAMIESPLIDELKAEWTREATRETLVKAMIDILAARFGPKAEALEDKLKGIEDQARLEELVRDAATCRTISSFRKRLEP